MGKSLHDGGLTGTRFTYQNRVVLRTTAQDLQYPTDFLVTANHRVKLPGTGSLNQVDGILVQRLVGVFT